MKVPPSTSSLQRRSYSSSDPSHRYTESGLQRSRTSLIQAVSFVFFILNSSVIIILFIMDGYKRYISDVGKIKNY